MCLDLLQINFQIFFKNYLVFRSFISLDDECEDEEDLDLDFYFLISLIIKS